MIFLTFYLENKTVSEILTLIKKIDLSKNQIC